MRPCCGSISNRTVSSPKPARKASSFAKRPATRSGLRKAVIGSIMKFTPIRCSAPSGKPARSTAGFTLAEVLAALVFMAIVIPVAVQGLRTASLAGQVAVRKSEAARVAERVLNESIVTTNWNKSGLSGTAIEGTHQFSWVMRNEAWNQDPIRLLSVQVVFALQGQQYDV